MAETLKFGPEWLRALSDGNSVTSPPPSPGFPKYKLAEHRYGREEMLALFHPNKHIPEEILSIPVILLEKAQDPMAYIPMTDEEQRMMSQSVNSPAVLRMMGRGSSGAGGGTVGPTRGGDS
ncbi:GRB10-interacting GYF protein 1-like [Lineus longissimus]|uniref:GRB10-interacting GYF protein 1-like n=1 Tax=Lineus longissimus TaxID=88925 RepID=UPI00315D4911